MVRSSFSILFVIRDSRVKKDGTASIEIALTVNGERCDSYISSKRTGCKTYFYCFCYEIVFGPKNSYAVFLL